jgi:outer membrane immunogenic protein
MRIVLALAALAPLAVAQTAMAAEERPFDGPYAGVVIGYDHVTADVSGTKTSRDGLAYGGLVGYDRDLGPAVVGAEIELDGDTTHYTGTNLAYPGDSAHIKAGRDLYVGARAGYKVAPNILLYAKGGYTNARLSGTYNDGEGDIVNAATDIGGYRLGGGIQVQYGKIGVRVEYRYSDYGDVNYGPIDTGRVARRQQIGFTALTKF